MNKPKVIEKKLRELVRTNNRILRKYLRERNEGELDRLELNRITMQKYMELA